MNIDVRIYDKESYVVIEKANYGDFWGKERKIFKELENISDQIPESSRKLFLKISSSFNEKRIVKEYRIDGKDKEMIRKTLEDFGKLLLNFINTETEDMFSQILN